MNPIIQQVSDLITNNPGNLIYHLVLAFSIMGALQAALHFWRSDEFPQGRRMVIGLGLLLGTRMILLILAIWGSLGSKDWHLLLPIVDRAMMAFALILIVWLWTFPEPIRSADTTSALLGLSVFTLFLLNQVWWTNHHSDSAFNAQALSIAWEILAIFLLIVGGVFISLQKPSRSRFGLSMMIVLIAGHIGQLFLSDVNSDFPGVVRFFEMAAYPLLWALPNRFNGQSMKPNQVIAFNQQIKEHKRYGVNPDTFHSILSLSIKTPSEQTCKKMTKLLTEIMVADIGLLILPPDNIGQITIQCGYDLITNAYLQSKELTSEQIPNLVSAMKHMRPLRLHASSTSKDLVSLKHSLGIRRTGHLLAAFVPPSKGENPLMGFIFISPYTDKRWTQEDQEFINKIATTLSLNFRHADQLEKTRKELEVTQQNLHSFQKLQADTQTENEGLRAELAMISTQTTQGMEKEAEAFINHQQESHDLIQNLREENSRLGKIIEDFNQQEAATSLNAVHLEEELKLALTEISQLKAQIKDTENQKYPIKRDARVQEKLDDNQIEIITSLSQELRQPMSSIVGYTELLLGESVGILGALQRKFLERVKVSIERMDALLEDLFHVVTIDSEGVNLKPEPVDFGIVIDKALADTHNLMKKRKIMLRVDLPEKMPHLMGDRDALEQVLTQLIKNAGTVTPENGQISLKATTHQIDGIQDYLQLEIVDQGGGISKEDLPRVFSRLYRADNPLIQGIGDTGVGLSIAKALVEAHNGRIWVDTESGKGSTFSIIIPLSNQNTSFQGNSLKEAGE